ncbi:MAG: ABC transporter permease [Chloroflexi bacterium]|nr:MAG: ABC transporter permease [Chloroflexota bacterium]
MRYLASRLIWMLPVMLGITIITFVVTQVIPADPVAFVAGQRASPEQIEQVRRYYGLDKSLPLQYLAYLNRLAHGELGESMLSRRPVAVDLAAYLPATVELALVSILLVVLLGLPLGILSAVRQNTWLDHSSRVVTMLGVSMPAFWLGLLFQLVFYHFLKILPMSGRLADTFQAPPHMTGLYTVDALLAEQWAVFWDALKHLILPSVTLCTASLAVLSRQVRSAMLEVMRQQYVTTARAKGLTERFVIMRHALRNAMIPIITIVALQTGALLSGEVLVETIFSWPGIGLYALRSVLAVDYHPIMSIALVIAVAYMLTSLLADLLYSLADPRLRRS